MKKGFFSTLSTGVLPLLFSFLCLQGCASFLQVSGGDDPSDYDRGYSRDNSQEEEAAADADTKTDLHKRNQEANAADELNTEKRRVKLAIETRDIILGMTRHDVTESWGMPSQREVAGKGSGGHERWTYGSRFSLNGSRTVIFENGRVAGWSH